MSKAANVWLHKALVRYGGGRGMAPSDLLCHQYTSAAHAALMAMHIAVGRNDGRKMPMATLWNDLNEDGVPAQLGVDLGHSARVLGRAYALNQYASEDWNYPVGGWFDEIDVHDFQQRARRLVRMSCIALLDLIFPESVPTSGKCLSAKDGWSPLVPMDRTLPASRLRSIRLNRADALKRALSAALAEQAPQTSILKVLLHGSWSRGDFDGCSDVDLIVIVPDQDSTSLHHYDLRLNQAVDGRRLDIMILTATRWASMCMDPQEDPMGVARAAAKEGQVVWRREGTS